MSLNTKAMHSSFAYVTLCLHLSILKKKDKANKEIAKCFSFILFNVVPHQINARQYQLML